jgi:hypothetical protein
VGHGNIQEFFLGELVYFLESDSYDDVYKLLDLRHNTPNVLMLMIWFLFYKS